MRNLFAYNISHIDIRFDYPEFAANFSNCFSTAFYLHFLFYSSDYWQADKEKTDACPRKAILLL